MHLVQSLANKFSVKFFDIFHHVTQIVHTASSNWRCEQYSCANLSPKFKCLTVKILIKIFQKRIFINTAWAKVVLLSQICEFHIWPSPNFRGLNGRNNFYKRIKRHDFICSLIPSILRSKELVPALFPIYVVIERLCHSIDFIHIFLREIR